MSPGSNKNTGLDSIWIFVFNVALSHWADRSSKENHHTIIAEIDKSTPSAFISYIHIRPILASSLGLQLLFESKAMITKFLFGVGGELFLFYDIIYLAWCLHHINGYHIYACVYFKRVCSAPNANTVSSRIMYVRVCKFRVICWWKVISVRRHQIFGSETSALAHLVALRLQSIFCMWQQIIEERLLKVLKVRGLSGSWLACLGLIVPKGTIEIPRCYYIRRFSPCSR